MLLMRFASPQDEEEAMRLFATFDRFRGDAMAAVALAALVIAVFAITATFDFVDYDDQEVVLNNTFVRDGLTWSGLRWAWGFEQQPGAASWFNWPLTWMTHQADCQAYGLWAGGHHITNVMLHACGTVMFFVFLRRIMFACGMAFFLAALYAVHPAQIESVAWITSRKNVLSALFFFCAMSAYVRAHSVADAQRGITATLTWNALGVAAMLSKATAVTLPFVMLLTDWWPLKRITSAGHLWRLIGEKSFLLVFAMGTAVIGYRAQDTAGAIGAEVPLLGRLEHAVQAMNAYVWMFVSPFDLSPLYLRSHEPAPLGVTLAGALLIGSLTMAALAVARSRPGVAFGWLWFVVTLAPTIGLVPFGSQAWACRHLQIPMAGLLVAAGTACVTARHHVPPLIGTFGWAAAAAIFFSSTVLTVRQLPSWRNTPALAQAMLEHNPTSAAQWNNFAIVLDKHSAAAPEVIDDLFCQAAALPAAPLQQLDIAHDHGLFLLKQHEDERACEAFQTCLRVAESADQMQGKAVTNATINLAVGLTRLRRADEAALLLRSLHGRAPASATSLNALGNALLACDNHADALVAFEQGLALEPDDILLLCNAATAAALGGDEPTARRHLFRAQAKAPQDPAVMAAAGLLEEAR